MKKQLLIGVAVSLGICAFGQITSHKIGTTTYQKQSYGSIANRLVNNADGIFGVWNYASQTAPTSADLGSGYNHFDLTAWESVPVSRVENTRVRIPNIGITESGKEFIVSNSHTTGGVSTGLHIASRQTAGTGVWKDTTLTTVNVMSPHFCVGGADGNTLHIIAATQTQYTNSQNGALLYYRSQNAGATWDTVNAVIPEIDRPFYRGFFPDAYSIDAKGDTVVIVIGGVDVDVVMIKSINNGNTWTKTIIYPFTVNGVAAPLYDRLTQSIPTATPSETNDGSVNVLLDHSGFAHVFFGRMVITNANPGPPAPGQGIQYDATTDRMYYWKESGVNPPVVIAFAKDYNQDGKINVYEGQPMGYGTFQASLTSFPSSGIDADGRIYLTYSSIFEGLNSNDEGFDIAKNILIDPVSPGKSFRHQYIMRSDDNGNNWYSPVDITQNDYNDETLDKHEGVYGVMAKKVDDFIHLIVQDDEVAGDGITSVFDQGNTTADIIYYKVPIKAVDIDASIKENKSISNIDLFPNPATNAVRLTFNSLVYTKSTIKIYNVIGETVETLQKNIIIGANAISLEVSNYKPGIYFISDGKNFSQKLIVK